MSREKQRSARGCFYSITVFVKKKKEEAKEKNETENTAYMNQPRFINNTNLSQIFKTKADKVFESIPREYKNKIKFFLNRHLIFKKAINSI